MKKIFSIILGLALLNNVKGQVNIAAARLAPLGSTVTIKGVITNGSELGNIRYIQDASAGISIYGANLVPVNRKDSIIATGVLTSYNNLLEITPVSYTLLATNRPLPAPVVITPNQFAASHQAKIIQFNNVIFSNSGGTFAGNVNYTLTAGTQTCVARISTASSLVGQVIPTGAVNVTGIGSQYCSSPVSGCTTGFQLLVRDSNDIVHNSSIYLTRQPYPTNINISGFTVNWNTNIAGGFYIKYGKTPNLELGTIMGTGTSASPSISVTGATPATIYYVKAFSTNLADIDSSLTRVFCTKSLSSGTIKAYFNLTVDNTVSSGTNAFYNPQIADSLAAYINRAKSTIDVTIYNWDNSINGSKIITALNNAFIAGKKIRLIYDGSTSQSAIPLLNAGIKKVASPVGTNYTIMHNKFVIIDADYPNPNNAIVWTGSTNWTNAQLTTDANNVIIFQDQSMARGYKLEFDEMWGDSSYVSNPNIPLSKFGQFKKDNTPHEYNVNGTRVESYFSPSDGTTSHIVSTVGTANTDLYFGLLLNTRTDIATKIKNQITLNTLLSRGILNDTTAGTTAFNIMQSVMGSNLRINSFPWLFHHKYLIVDQSNITSDPILLTGSHNWSTAGETKNDENIVIVHDPTIANLYFQEFTKRWNDQVTLNIADHKNDGSSILLYPNPTNNQLNVKLLNNEVIKSLTITNLLGKTIFTSKENNEIIDISKFANGLYTISILSENNNYQSKFVVEK